MTGCFHFPTIRSTHRQENLFPHPLVRANASKDRTMIGFVSIHLHSRFGWSFRSTTSSRTTRRRHSSTPLVWLSLFPHSQICREKCNIGPLPARWLQRFVYLKRKRVPLRSEERRVGKEWRV